MEQPFACYDIKSVTIAGSEAEPRYIEVKAVTERSFQFFWTASEMEVAQLLGESYYLYLLPVKEGHTFDLERLRIIQDPHKKILSSENWVLRNEVISCYLAKDTTSSAYEEDLLFYPSSPSC